MRGHSGVMNPAAALAARRLAALFGGVLAAVVVGEKVMHRVWRLDRRRFEGDDDADAGPRD